MSSNVNEEQITPEQDELVVNFSFYVPILSLIGASLVFFIVLISRLLKLPSSRRLSFKLSLWVALSDIVFILAYMFPFFLVGLGDEMMNYILELRAVRVLNIMLPIFGNIWYVFLISAMSANLYYSFVNVRSKLSGKFTEFNMVVTTLVATLIIIVPPTIACIIYNMRSIIYITENKSARVLLTWLQVNLWISLSIIYSSVVVFHVTNTLLKHRRTVISLTNDHENLIVVKKNPSYSETQSSVFTATHLISNSNPTSSSKVNSSQVITNSLELRRRLNLVAIRVTGYVLVPIITLPLFVIISSYISYTNDRYNMTLVLFYDLMPNLSGLLNAIVFCFDPALPDIYDQLKLKYWADTSFGSTGLSSSYTEFEGNQPSQFKNRSIADLTDMEMNM